MTVEDFTYGLAPLNPMVSSKFYQTILENGPKNFTLEPWDLAMDFGNLKDYIPAIKKLLAECKDTPETKDKDGAEPKRCCCMDKD